MDRSPANPYPGLVAEPKCRVSAVSLVHVSSGAQGVQRRAARSAGRRRARRVPGPPGHPIRPAAAYRPRRDFLALAFFFLALAFLAFLAFFLALAFFFTAFLLVVVDCTVAGLTDGLTAAGAVRTPESTGAVAVGTAVGVPPPPPLGGADEDGE